MKNPQMINMTRAELHRRMKIAKRAINDVPPMIQPLLMAKVLRGMYVEPCNCGKPDCMSRPFTILVDAARLFVAFSDKYGKFPESIALIPMPNDEEN